MKPSVPPVPLYVVCATGDGVVTANSKNCALRAEVAACGPDQWMTWCPEVSVATELVQPATTEPGWLVLFVVASLIWVFAAPAIGLVHPAGTMTFTSIVVSSTPLNGSVCS